ncbi:MAG: Glu-tRNA(Gln) amidotransferase subunit GatE [Candidatus Micrarchaeia archaeon]
MKCGLEIHQRLDVGKLFCSCASEARGEARWSVVRRLHPVASELGEIDVAAQFEALRDRTFSYQVFDDASCLVELDEEPPHGLNPKALEAALEIALLLKARPVDEVHVMRKIVIDGSNTSGFQRTAIVALNGSLTTSAGTVGIPTICLEEESAGIVGESEGKVSYRLDRLGIPLIEIATEPVLASPEHVREVAEKIGLVLRSTGKVMRGIGTIRQDINVSIEGGARVEIKGAQELALIAPLVENEVKRQRALLTILAEARARFGGKVGFEAKAVDVSALFAATQAKVLRTALERGERVLALRLPKFAGLLGREIGPGRRFGTELADYARAAGARGIIHSDEDLTRYGITQAERAALERALSCTQQDGWVLVACTQEVGERALAEIAKRAAADFIPEETRRANPDGTSSYMRPLPGRARMYPETDVQPVRITAEMIEKISSRLPKPLEERRDELLKLLPTELAEKILRSPRLSLFERAVARGCEPVFVAVTIEETLRALARKGIAVDRIGDDRLAEFFSTYARGVFAKAAAPDILAFLAQHPDKSTTEAVRALGLERITGDALRRVIEKEGKELAAFMAKYRLRVEAGEVQAILKRKR